MADFPKIRQIKPATFLPVNLFSQIFLEIAPNSNCQVSKFYPIFLPNCVFVRSFKVK